MIKIDFQEMAGLPVAIHSMRNAWSSWDKADSKYRRCDEDCDYCCNVDCFGPRAGDEGFIVSYCVGPADRELAMNLRNAGTDHRKYLRMIEVWMDITAPLYWWKEFDTYKVGTVANSTSTMHTIAKKEFTLDDFSHEHLHPDTTLCLQRTIDNLNIYRNLYLEKKDKRHWWQMIQLLPSSYNQLRTIKLSYEVLANIYKSRRGHRLDEWREFCKWIEELPYSRFITGVEDNDEQTEAATDE